MVREDNCLWSPICSRPQQVFWLYLIPIPGNIPGTMIFYQESWKNFIAMFSFTYAVFAHGVSTTLCNLVFSKFDFPTYFSLNLTSAKSPSSLRLSQVIHVRFFIFFLKLVISIYKYVFIYTTVWLMLVSLTSQQEIWDRHVLIFTESKRLDEYMKFFEPSLIFKCVCKADLNFEDWYKTGNKNVVFIEHSVKY
jgi:hypothetical protein